MDSGVLKFQKIIKSWFCFLGKIQLPLTFPLPCLIQGKVCWKIHRNRTHGGQMYLDIVSNCLHEKC